MKISNLFAEAGSSIVLNKGRSLLTILGVVIGIAAVTAIFGLGEGVNTKVDNEISKLGSTNLTIESRIAPTTEELAEKDKPGHKAPEGAPETQKATSSVVEPALTAADLDGINNLGDTIIANTSPLVQLTAKAQTSLSTISVLVQGVSDSYATIRNYQIASGTFVTTNDVSQNSKVVVLGSQLATSMFASSDPIGQNVVINDVTYAVIGVLSQAESGQFDNPNVTIYSPYTTVIKQNDLSEKFGSIIVSATNEEKVAEAKKTIESLLLANHQYTNTDEADFTIKSSAELLGAFTGLTDLFRKVLTGSAAISLLVGGIGIMNIMLVSVTERTKEIGLRKAVGAKTRHIMMQFLAEAVALTVLGGVIGVIAGQLLAMGMTKALGLDITPAITVMTLFVTVSISVSIGIIFGIYPALRAAKLDPIDALRYE